MTYPPEETIIATHPLYTPLIEHKKALRNIPIDTLDIYDAHIALTSDGWVIKLRTNVIDDGAYLQIPLSAVTPGNFAWKDVTVEGMSREQCHTENVIVCLENAITVADEMVNSWRTGLAAAKAGLAYIMKGTSS